jgi:hypothetical protein
VEERRLVRVLVELCVGDRDAHLVAELLEVVQRELLHLVGRVAALEGRPEAVALHRLGEDHRRLAAVLGRSLERGVDLAVVVPAALEIPDLLVRVALDELGGARVAAEEVLPDVCAALGLVGLVVAVRRAVHQVDESAVAVAGEQLIPLAAPHHLDDVPSRTAEEALELLDDLPVAAHRAVQSLEVAVDHEGEVVEGLVGRPLEGAAALHLIHLAVAQERPHLLVGGVLDAAEREVLVRLRLVDRVDRPEPHRDGRELPEVRHEPRMRVAGEPVRGLRLLLPEADQLVLAEPSLEVGARVHTGGGVALEEDLVAAARMVLPAEEPVLADLVQRR